MICISHVLLYAFTTGPKPIFPRGLTWPQLRGGIWCQINRKSHQSLQGILDCQRQHCDNSKSHPDFQPSPRLRPRPRGNGFCLCRKLPRPPEKPLSWSLWSWGNPTGTRSPIGLVWILGNVPVVSTKRQATFLKSHFPTSKQVRLNNLSGTHCRSCLLELVLWRGWGHITEARGKGLLHWGLGFGLCGLVCLGLLFFFLKI